MIIVSPKYNNQICLINDFLRKFLCLTLNMVLNYIIHPKILQIYLHQT